MNTRAICMTLCLLLAGTAWGQPDSVWIKSYPNLGFDICKNIVATQDGGFVLAGNSNLVFKADANGDSIWSTKIDRVFNERCERLISTEDGGFALVGYSRYANCWDDYRLLRLSENGEHLWSDRYGQGPDDSEKCNAIIQTSDGGFALLGWFNTYNVNIYRTWLLATDENGDSLWSQIYDPSIGANKDIIQTADGGFLMVGYNGAVKTDGNGQIEWTQPIGNRVKCQRVIPSNDSYAIAGINDNYELFMTLLNEDGEIIWLRTYPSMHTFHCSITEADDGGYLVGVNHSSNELRLLRTNRDGDSLWTARYLGGEYTVHGSIARIPGAGFVIGGNRFWFQDVLFILRMPDRPFEIVEDSLAVGRMETVQPNSIILSPPYPNPFNSTTLIGFDLSAKSASSAVNLAIFDPLGRRIADLIPPGTAGLPAGSHSVIWNAAGVPAGHYLIRLEAGGLSEVAGVQVVK
jgi:hypothetical protein